MVLNPAQRAAVEHVRGPLLVLAGAGSGKTRVITEKIARLVRGGLAAPKITAITFTNKAAREMRERAERLLGRRDDADAPRICTFHALGLKFLQIEHARAGLRRGFSVFDADDAAALVAELMPAAARREAVDSVRAAIARAKNEGLSPESAAGLARSPREVEAAAIYAKYQRRLAAFNAVDFDDLIRLPLALLEGDPELAGSWRERIRYLLVDEYQDTNRAQYRLLRALAGSAGHFTCVGDDDQSIYAWRGADPENLNELARDYPDLTVIKLEQNYRCSARILRAANALIANNRHLFEKRLWSDQGEGPPIRVHECADEDAEAERLAADLAVRQRETKLLWADFAVLYRGNHQSRPIEKALRLLRIPYHVSGGQAFFDRAEVKDLLAWLRLVANPDDDAAFLRAVVAPRREVGAGTLERLGEIAGQRHLSLLRAAASVEVLKLLAARPAAALGGFVDTVERLRERARRDGVAGLADALVETTGYAAHLDAQASDPALRERRLANVAELVEWLKQSARRAGDDGVGDLAAQLAILAHADRDEPGNAVRLMTLHAAKGLEFRQVFIIGCEEGTLPHEGALDEGRLDEERRLFYVGITRAKDGLVLSYAAKRQRYGETRRLEPSRFLAELPEADLRRDGRDPEADAADRAARRQSHLEHLAALLDPR